MPGVDIPTGPVVFLHRQDDSVSFNRNWADYKKGFGSESTNYWMGLDRLHALTSSKAYGLKIEMTDWDDFTLWVGHKSFIVGPESSNYTLTVDGYDARSTVHDEIYYHNGMMFSTYDRDNDNEKYFGCAEWFLGGWWYDRCYHVHPTGKYLASGVCNDKGIVYWDIPGYCRSYSHKQITFTLIPK